MHQTKAYFYPNGEISGLVAKLTNPSAVRLDLPEADRLLETILTPCIRKS